MKMMLCFCLVMAVVLHGCGTVGANVPLPPLSQQEEVLLAKMWRARISGDHAQTSVMLNYLKKPVTQQHPALTHTAMQALARLGAMEALTTIEEMAQRSSPGSSPVQRYAQVARARLLAEESIGENPPSAAVKMRRYLSALKLTPNQINAALSNSNQRFGDQQNVPEIVASREIVDMIYHKRDMTLAKQAQALGIRLDLNASFVVELQIAPLSRQERVEWLIKELKKADVLSSREYHLIQLTAAEGKTASHAAAVALEQMRSSGQIYNYGAVAGLLKVIGLVADKGESPIVLTFSTDSNPALSRVAQQVLRRIERGVPADY